ncbi:methyltransferase domain-containing protein [Pseudomonas umsongensis]|uniref:methyltransferase domain-containing protein n=1 Tax=Pseudomonas umsongensis TaxID=198618 RepID=UPI00200A8A3F|nr:methyltransferase domain-containing protein [Pseudomonas umsongensis]MCK8687409.1 methyltransferase domain-containing protein [Pseudomonas umsongensis]
MLIPNNPDLDFQELNRRIEAEVERYRLGNSERALPVFNPSPAERYDRPYGWMQLIQLEDEALARAAYPTLIGRKAENAELQSTLNKLRSGWDKFEVLAELRYSPEGNAHNADVQGLRRARLKNTIRRIPVVGKLILSAYGMMLNEARNRHYIARMDLLTRQIKQHNGELLGHKDLVQNQHDVQQKYLQELNTYLQDHQKVLQDHQNALQEHHEAQKRQAEQFELFKEQQIAHLEAELKQSRTVQQELRARLQQLERQPRQVSVATPHDTAAAVPAVLQHQSSIPDSFYLAFENRFRGDAETIRGRQSYYLPILDAIMPLSRGLPLVDIGCGRGEWLQMLPENYSRIGVDLNSMNVEACHEQGLSAVQQDALVWLAQQPENSLAAVTAFHVIEHLTFEQFNTLLDECQRVLAPGGVIIFETPNPENLVSAATHFYTDPTHLHPLPPAFTEFLVEFKGFEQVQIHRLNPIPREYALNEDSEVARRCDALFYGPQDYAVVASKSLT